MPEHPDRLLSASLSSYLASGERVEHRVTNTRSGVARERAGTTERIEPADERGAVAAVTDHRLLVLVGRDGEDRTASIPHAELAAARVEAGTLTRDLVVETVAGARWSFTARESDTLDGAVDALADRIDPAERVERALERARGARDEALEAGDVERTADRADAAVAAYRTAASIATADPGAVGVDFAKLRCEVVETVEIGLEAHRQRAREARSRGNWELQRGDEASAVDHHARALESFERAHDLATECPPGDPETLAEKRDALLDRLAEQGVREAVVEAAGIEVG